MTVRQLETQIEVSELYEWMAFFAIEPWGAVRADYRAGVVASTLVNVNGGKKGKKPAQATDFFNLYQNHSNRKQTNAQQMSIMKRIARSQDEKKDFKVVRRRHGLYNEFEVKGLDMLDRELERMGEEVATKLGKEAVEKALRPVSNRVKSNITSQNFKGTGALMESVRTTVNLSKKPRGIKGDVRVGVDRRGRYKKSGRRKPAYALQLEYGTTDANPFGAQPPRPFMRPAFDGHERRMAADARNALYSTIFKWKLRDTK